MTQSQSTKPATTDAPDKGNKGGAWENLNFQTKRVRLNLLKSILVHVQVQVVSINTQMRFLVEDVFNGRYEQDDPHFLTCCQAIDGLIRKFVRSNQTTDQHLDNLMQVIEYLMEDVQAFIARGYGLIAKIVELRDMVHLAFLYLEAEYALNVKGFIPSKIDLFESKAEEKKRKGLLGSCCCSKAVIKASQFFNTEYEGILLLHSVKLTSPDMEIMLK